MPDSLCTNSMTMQAVGMPERSLKDVQKHALLVLIEVVLTSFATEAHAIARSVQIWYSNLNRIWECRLIVIRCPVCGVC